MQVTKGRAGDCGSLRRNHLRGVGQAARRNSGESLISQILGLLVPRFEEIPWAHTNAVQRAEVVQGFEGNHQTDGELVREPLMNDAGRLVTRQSLASARIATKFLVK